MGGAVWLDSRETAGGRQQSASARAGFDPSRPLPSPLSPTRLQEERQLGSKVWEGYGEGEGRTSLNPGRRREPRVGEGTSRDKPDWGAILPFAAGETGPERLKQWVHNPGCRPPYFTSSAHTSVSHA